MKPSIEIELPIKRVFELFMDKTNFKEWKKDFISYEHISGTAGEVGAVTKLVYKRVTMFETIISKNSPTEIIAEYEHKSREKTIMFHRAVNHFTALSDKRTLLEVDMKITKIVGFLAKIIMTIMAGAGKKYAQTQLNQLKVFAERVQ